MYKLDIVDLDHLKKEWITITLQAPLISDLIPIVECLQMWKSDVREIGCKLTSDNDLNKPFFCFVFDLNMEEFNSYLVGELKKIENSSN